MKWVNEKQLDRRKKLAGKRVKEIRVRRTEKKSLLGRLL